MRGISSKLFVLKTLGTPRVVYISIALKPGLGKGFGDVCSMVQLPCGFGQICRLNCMDVRYLGTCGFGLARLRSMRESNCVQTV